MKKIALLVIGLGLSVTSASAAVFDISAVQKDPGANSTVSLQSGPVRYLETITDTGVGFLATLGVNLPAVGSGYFTVPKFVRAQFDVTPVTLPNPESELLVVVQLSGADGGFYLTSQVNGSKQPTPPLAVNDHWRLRTQVGANSTWQPSSPETKKVVLASIVFSRATTANHPDTININNIILESATAGKTLTDSNWAYLPPTPADNAYNFEAAPNI